MISCIDVPTLPLQLLLREKPEWRKHPTVVVAEDTPTAEILHASTAAVKRGVARGMRLAAARAVTRELCVGVVEESAMRVEVDAIFRRLYGFSPRIEPDVRVVGRFYADPSGLGTLFGALATWAKSVHDALAERGLVSSIVVGFHRARVTALAATRRGVLVVPSAEK